MDDLNPTEEIAYLINLRKEVLTNRDEMVDLLERLRKSSREFYQCYMHANDGKSDIYLKHSIECESDIKQCLNVMDSLLDNALSIQKRIEKLRS